MLFLSHPVQLVGETNQSTKENGYRGSHIIYITDIPVRRGYKRKHRQHRSRQVQYISVSATMFWVAAQVVWQLTLTFNCHSEINDQWSLRMQQPPCLPIQHITLDPWSAHREVCLAFNLYLEMGWEYVLVKYCPCLCMVHQFHCMYTPS